MLDRFRFSFAQLLAPAWYRYKLFKARRLLKEGAPFNASEIIPKQLYLGNLVDAINHEELKKRNIKYLVTAIHSMPQFTNDFEERSHLRTVPSDEPTELTGTWWVRVPVLDHEDDTVSAYFDSLNQWIANRICKKENIDQDHDLLIKTGMESFPFPMPTMYGDPKHNISISDKSTETITMTANADEIVGPAKSEQGAVLVHCIQGKSRSAALVIAYIMWSKGLRYEDALDFVRAKRSLVNPNPTFVRELRMYEDTLRSRGIISDKKKTAEQV